MKKTLLIIGLALVTGVINLSAQNNTITISVPTNVPLAVVQRSVLNNAQMIAYGQIRVAILPQLETAFPGITTASGSNIVTARNMVLGRLRGATTVEVINSDFIAKLPYVTRTNAVGR